MRVSLCVRKQMRRNCGILHAAGSEGGGVRVLLVPSAGVGRGDVSHRDGKQGRLRQCSVLLCTLARGTRERVQRKRMHRCNKRRSSTHKGKFVFWGIRSKGKRAGVDTSLPSLPALLSCSSLPHPSHLHPLCCWLPATAAAAGCWPLLSLLL